MLQPVVRRTWGLRGQTPILEQYERHDRISAISAITVSPLRRRLGLYWDLRRRNICGEDIVAFLGWLRRSLRRRLVLIWDRWSVDKALAVREYMKRCGGAIVVEWLPSYAPELNPAEQVWNHTKYSDLANHSPDDWDTLESAVNFSLYEQSTQCHLLRSFFKTAGLDL